ncbi:hypothetical protein F4677DRAFT_442868 [Hypoxylon crocopeplum]|nr:hypothetical protein F4677DRAFT_442868 [Hypoxylon crocopeplum]
MVSKLVLPQCEQHPTHMNHSPPPEKPLRIQIMGFNKYLDRLFDDGTKLPTPKHEADIAEDFIEPGLRLARMAFRLLYGRDPEPETSWDMIPQHQYDHLLEAYAVTFDHLVRPDNEDDPETLMMNVIDPNDPSVACHLKVDKSRYSWAELVLLKVPRCCQDRTGTTDRWRINCEEIAKASVERSLIWCKRCIIPHLQETS